MLLCVCDGVCTVVACASLILVRMLRLVLLWLWCAAAAVGVGAVVLLLSDVAATVTVVQLCCECVRCASLDVCGCAPRLVEACVECCS